MSKKLIFNKEKCLEDFEPVKELFGDKFIRGTMEWINECDGKPCYKEDGIIYCDPTGLCILPYEVRENWCDIIEED